MPVILTRPHSEICVATESFLILFSIQTGEYDWSNEEKSVLLGSFSWCMGVAQLIGALLCQKYGGKIVFGISNLSLGVLSLLIPAAADFGVIPVIAIRAVQGILGVNIHCFFCLQSLNPYYQSSM